MVVELQQNFVIYWSEWKALTFCLLYLLGFKSQYSGGSLDTFVAAWADPLFLEQQRERLAE